MGSWASGKTVTLHYTLEALTLGAARDPDAITSLEQRNGELLAHLINFTVVRGEFTHELRRGLEARLNSVSDFSLVGTLRLLRAEANLDSRVAIRVIPTFFPINPAILRGPPLIDLDLNINTGW